MKKVIILLLSVCICSFANAYVVTFDDMSSDEFHVGNTFTSGGMNFTADRFWILGGDTIGDGFTKASNDGLAGGAGKEMLLTNINLKFDFAVKPLSGVSLMFSELNGDVNLSINGDMRPVADFSDLKFQTVGGVMVFVNGSNASGSIFAVGNINSFEIGGNNLAIDNVIACIPEPASMALLALGGLLLRKRKPA